MSKGKLKGLKRLVATSLIMVLVFANIAYAGSVADLEGYEEALYNGLVAMESPIAISNDTVGFENFDALVRYIGEAYNSVEGRLPEFEKQNIYKLDTQGSSVNNLSDGQWYLTNINYNVVYKNTKEELAQVDLIVKEFVSLNINDSMNDYEKIWTVYDFVTDVFYYEKIASSSDTQEEFDVNIISERNLKKGLDGTNGVVCEAYSMLFHLLLVEMGYRTQFVHGTAYTGADESNHIWNTVEVDGQYYMVDVTWADVEIDELIAQYKSTYPGVEEAIIQNIVEDYARECEETYFLTSNTVLAENDHYWLVNDYPIANSIYLAPEPIEEPEVIPNTPPVVTLNGEASINILKNNDYTELSAIATDEEDGQLEVETTGSVDTGTTGTYTIVYSATDSEGETSSVARTVNVNIGASPVIEMNGEDSMTLDFKSEFEDPMAVATDPEDGNVEIVITNQVNTLVPGTYNLTYSATDTQGNVSEAVRIVVVLENQVPIVTLIGDDIIIDTDDDYVELGANASDHEDGDLDPIISGSVDDDREGLYVITYTARDEEGLEHIVTRNVIVNEPELVVEPDVEEEEEEDAQPDPEIEEEEEQEQEQEQEQSTPSSSSNSSSSPSPVVATILPVEEIIQPIVEEEVVKPVDFEMKEKKAHGKVELVEGRMEAFIPVKEILDTESITLESDMAIVEIPTNIIKDMEGVTLEVSEAIVTRSIKNLVDGNKVYDFNLYNGEEQVSKFSEPIVISIPYELKEGENPDLVTVFYIADDGSLANMKGTYKEGKVTFKTSHFSKYFAKENNVTFFDTIDERVIELASKGIINGKGDGLFDPEGYLTRAELATLLVKALDLEINTDTQAFDDVVETDWFYNYVMTAKEAGIVNGVGDGDFDPNGYVRNQDAIIMISRVMETYKESVNTSEVLSFDNTSDYASSYIAHLIELGFIEDNFKDGLSNINRQNMATLVHHMYFSN